MKNKVSKWTTLSVEYRAHIIIFYIKRKEQRFLYNKKKVKNIITQVGFNLSILIYHCTLLFKASNLN